jgi:hypothetical protein
MLRLEKAREPFWLEIMPGVRIRFRPVTVAAILLARASAAEVLRDGGSDADVRAGIAFTTSLARSGIISWEGVGDEDGNPVDPGPETIGALLDHWQVFDAIDRLYVAPVLLQSAEKNA